MKKGLLLVIFSVFALNYFLKAQPATEIFLFDLSVKKNAVQISNPVNITNRRGYDNQPYFHPDKTILYYVSEDSVGRTDIFQYNYLTKQTRRLTHTPEREYSPTVTPDKRYISCIIQRDNGAQDLGKYPIDGEATPTILISDQVIGYHAWADSQNAAVLALPKPYSLHLINFKTKKDSILTDSVGRSLHKVPGENAISFVQQLKDNVWMIRKVVSEPMKINDITISMLSKEHDMAWTPDLKIIMSNESKLFFINTKGKGEWKEVSIDGNITGKSFTRIAVNNKGDKLALVISED
ncbi:TolB family protein [Chryseosolibacter indicus]|uniref:PD40 domain-containing protein n=1 Tax=Chryseosolibacter indicus TaxID=2782351 RepID=A0ABS5VTS4_9BACT|nr:hypothetical protein [Chryseosolibacter indicus]MBT1704227.1 PD40 domain-containing protein [Chryseosolibacter indicus]